MATAAVDTRATSQPRSQIVVANKNINAPGKARRVAPTNLPAL